MSYVIQGLYDPQFEHVIDTFLAQLPQAPRQGGAALTVYHQNQKVIIAINLALKKVLQHQMLQKTEEQTQVLKTTN